MMMMLSNSRVLVNNGTTTTSVAKKSTKVTSFRPLFLSFSLFSRSFIQRLYIINILKEMLWIISLSFLYTDDIEEQKKNE